MKTDNVPQDNSKTYSNNKKAIYATNKEGSVDIIGSSGWEVEEFATNQALLDLQENALEAYNLVKDGLKSPLYFHMYDLRMDLQVLADSTGFFKWTIKRDFDPNKFSKISSKRLQTYADAMGKTTKDIKTISYIKDRNQNG